MVDGDNTYPADSGPEMVAQVLGHKVDMVIGDRLSSIYFEENKRPFHNFRNRIDVIMLIPLARMQPARGIEQLRRILQKPGHGFVTGKDFFEKSCASLVYPAHYHGVFPYVLVSLAPIVWFAFAANHSDAHFWFTNKAFCVTLFGVLLIICHYRKNSSNT